MVSFTLTNYCFRIFIHPYHVSVTFLGAFTYLWKVPISFVMPVRVYQLCFHWMDFREIWFWRLFILPGQVLPNFVKIWQKYLALGLCFIVVSYIKLPHKHGSQWYVSQQCKRNRLLQVPGNDFNTGVQNIGQQYQQKELLLQTLFYMRNIIERK